jgi:hypothetical protein
LVLAPARPLWNWMAKCMRGSALSVWMPCSTLAGRTHDAAPLSAL